MVDIAVKSGAAWVCHAEGQHLTDVLRPVHVGDKDDHEEELGQSEGDETNWSEAFSTLTVCVTWTLLGERHL